MPSLARKIQIAFDWLWQLFFPRDIAITGFCFILMLDGAVTMWAKSRWIIITAMVLTAIGVCAGTFLSWPVALLTTIAFFVAGQLAFAFLVDFTRADPHVFLGFTLVQVLYAITIVWFSYRLWISFRESRQVKAVTEDQAAERV